MALAHTLNHTLTLTSISAGDTYMACTRASLPTTAVSCAYEVRYP